MKSSESTGSKIHEDSNALVFLNTPIHNESEDILGLQAQVNSLQAAIDCGAQMIAVTSPFGAGKSSVAELLCQNREDQRIITVSMWSHLCKKLNPSDSNSTTELHRSFLYQIISKLSDQSGAYISRRLSKNYGLLKLHTENPRYYVAAFLSLMFFVVGYILPYVLDIGIPTIWGKAEIWNGLFLLASVVCLIYVIIRAEIVFSSNKSEGSRTIDENELIELYRKFVIKYCNKKKKYTHYIFIIEDLDRTEEHDCVITFLKELRKYYMQTGTCKNKIVFVVNVKPESSLFDDHANHKSSENESLYAKLFDYILNIQTINIDDYETVLESILQQNKTYIQKLFPTFGVRLVDLPGMQWIIRGKNFGVRDIKDRLNRAFTLYASLCDRFGRSNVVFEKCAAVAYLTTAHEKEFIQTGDHSFGNLVEAYLQHKLDDSLCETELGSDNTEYIKDVRSLIDAKMIDANYRMYFYNYPKNSRIYNHDENAVQNAILYGDIIEGFNDIVSRVAIGNPQVIFEALDRLKKLKLPLPDVVFKYEPLYVTTLQHYPEGICEWISKLDNSKNAFERINKQLLEILSFDSTRSVYSDTHALRLCEVLEELFSEDQLLQFRKNLCLRHSSEILWYTPLFFGVHNIITESELGLLNLDSAILLINVQKDSFSEQYVHHILQRFEEIPSAQQEQLEIVISFLVSSEEKLGSTIVAPYFLQFMLSINTIVADFEYSVMNQLTSGTLRTEQKEPLFISYQRLLNKLNPENISKDTLNNIHVLSRFKGYSEQIANLLQENGYLFDAIIVRLHLGTIIKYQEPAIISAIEDNVSWLEKNLETHKQLRLEIIKSCNTTDISNYIFLFSIDFPVLSITEFNSIRHRYSHKTIFSLLPASMVTKDQSPMLLQYFNGGFQQNTIAHDILLYISDMNADVARDIFYSLNFETAIKYSSFSAVRKNTIKAAFAQRLNLDATGEKIRFMEATRYLDSAWEEQICNALKNNNTYAVNYLSAANHATRQSITASTIKCICAIPGYHALNHNLTERLYTAKKYAHYVVSKALFNSAFILDDDERADQLWTTYMEIFTGSVHRQTKEHMDNNLAFLQAIQNRKAYISLPNDRRMVVSKIPQDSDCLRNVLTYGDTFAINYYSKIDGFSDADAAAAYVEIVESKPALLKSQVLYDHCHEMLVNPILKAKYTRLRKKYGYM